MDIYPNMKVKESKFENANVIHRWNHLKEDFLQEENYNQNHFHLPDDAIDFFEDIFDINIGFVWTELHQGGQTLIKEYNSYQLILNLKMMKIR